MTEPKRRDDDIEKVIDETIDELDITVKKSGRRILDVLLDGVVTKLEEVWNDNKIILKQKIKKGIKKITDKKEKCDGQNGDKD
jgi:hypothetical protein